MNIILWMLFGGIAAWVATMIIGNQSRQRTYSYVIAGMLGAVGAGFAMQQLTREPSGEINYYSLLVSVGGALLLVALLTYIRLQSYNKD